MEQSNGNSKHSFDQAPTTESSIAPVALGMAESCGNKRKLYAIEEREESSPVTLGELEPEAEAAYDADVDELEQPVACPPLGKLASERDVIYELFQPWALKTYGDQAKTKTITLHKKARILKALEGKEHSRPDSSKFRFWVKTKGFTTKRPDGFEEAPGSRRRLQPLPTTAVLSDNPGAVDLFAASASKDFGRRIYRKVACVEEFFDIIYNVHMELGGRSGTHAGQKRTYRIITETYAFLPREAVTRFLTICPECKKNLRPSSPAVQGCKESELAGNESSSEVENYLNYSSHTESSLETGPTAKRRRHSSADLKAYAPLAAGSVASSASATQLDAIAAPPPSSPTTTVPTVAPNHPKVEVANETQAVSVPKIRVKTQLQRPLSPLAAPAADKGAGSLSTTDPPQLHSIDMQLLKSRDNLVRYYDFMRRFYAGGSMLSQPVLAPPLYGSSLLQSLSYPTTTTITTSTTTNSNQPQSKQSSVSTPPKTVSTSNNPPLNQLKSSPDSSTRPRSPIVSIATPSIPQAPHTPINLTKPPFSSSSNGQPASTSTPVTVPPLKLELLSPPKPLPDLRIPQLLLRGTAPVEQLPMPLPMPLPPLDLERLKPITSTYLQLTRSMGLSDEDALRFDNLSFTYVTI
ncbi:hypothetical protein ACLKA6_007509 [Drosophila palustris]